MADWEYRVGQKVVISQYRGSRSGTDLYDGEVTKIGRKWITVKSGPWREERFDLDGRAEDQGGWAATLWPNREAYEADARRRRAWNMLHALVRQHNHPPAHLTTEQIEAMIAAVQPAEERGEQASIPTTQLGGKGHP